MHAHTLNKSYELALNERRLANRISIRAVLNCRYYSSTKERPSKAIMLNFSESGSYIESTEKFNIGSAIIYKLLTHPVDLLRIEVFAQPRSICLSEVRWCREIKGKDTVRYGMGLKYF